MEKNRDEKCKEKKFGGKKNSVISFYFFLSILYMD